MCTQSHTHEPKPTKVWSGFHGVLKKSAPKTVWNRDTMYFWVYNAEYMNPSVFKSH